MKIELNPEYKAYLGKLTHSVMILVIIAQRANILLKDAGKSGAAIADELGINRHTADLWIKKYCSHASDTPIEELLNVGAGRGRKAENTGEAKIWLISIACMKPKALGYVAETWTTSALTTHIWKTAAAAGFERLSTISESGLYSILDKANIKPFRIQYYCEWRASDFESKMHNVLLVYKQLSLQFDEDGNLIPFEGQAM